MAIRRIAVVYAVVSVLAVVAGAILEGIPLPRGSIAHSIFWIALGPLAVLFYAARDWSAVVFYLIGSALVASCFPLTTQSRRTVRIAGYFLTVITWFASGLLILALVWGA